MRKLVCVCVLLIASAACAELGGLRALVQPPSFAQVPGRPAEISLSAPTRSQPLGGANLRIWTRVTNPNPFGFTLGTLRGTLHLENSRAADVDFPLGLPLRATESTEIPIDLAVSFSDLPGLADAVRRAANREPLAYSLEGTIGVDAGQLGQPTFGPMTILQGQTRGTEMENGRWKMVKSCVPFSIYHFPFSIPWEAI